MLMFKILNTTKKNVIALKVNGKVKKEDYEKITPLMDSMIEDYGKIRCLAEISELHGVEPAAFWADLKFSLKHTDKFEKVAVVGATPIINAISKLSSPFTSAEVRVFSDDEMIKATDWIRE